MQNLLHDGSLAERNTFFEKEIWPKQFLWDLLLIRFQGDSQNAETSQVVLSDFYLRTLEEWEKIPKAPQSVMIAYLKKMLKNTLVDHWRAKMYKVSTQELKLNFDLEDTGGLADHRDEQITLEAINACMATFDDLDQQIFDLKYQQRKRSREIAITLNISHSTVDVRVMRMKEKFRKFFNLNLE